MKPNKLETMITNTQLKEIFDSCAQNSRVDTTKKRLKLIPVMDFEDFKKATEKILALGKPEPLAKNKQFVESCGCGRVKSQGLGRYKCRVCGDEWINE